MESLIMLGTGNASVTKCFNTCFALQQDERYFLVDTGGGNGILTQLEKAEIPLENIHDIFISHEHTDHLLGLVWMIRMIATKMKKDKYNGNLTIYCHEALVETIKTIAKLTLQAKFYNMIGERIFFSVVEDGKEKEILGYHITFFDIHSTKAKQFGFTTRLLNQKKITFLGDEPYRKEEYVYAKDADWLLEEAFCLYSQREIFEPYEKHHATVKEACETAKMLAAKSTILFHTEDKTLQNRQKLYVEEGKNYYEGNLLVPYDLERIVL